MPQTSLLPDTPEPPPAPPDEAVLEPPTIWQRHDLLVLIVGLALLAGGVLAYRSQITPELIEFAQYGLSLSRPSAWLPPQPVTPPPSRLAIAVGESEPPPATRPGALPFHVI